MLPTNKTTSKSSQHFASSKFAGLWWKALENIQAEISLYPENHNRHILYSYHSSNTDWYQQAKFHSSSFELTLHVICVIAIEFLVEFINRLLHRLLPPFSTTTTAVATPTWFATTISVPSTTAPTTKSKIIVTVITAWNSSQRIIEKSLVKMGFQSRLQTTQKWSE